MTAIPRLSDHDRPSSANPLLLEGFLRTLLSRERPHSNTRVLPRGLLLLKVALMADSISYNSVCNRPESRRTQEARTAS